MSAEKTPCINVLPFICGGRGSYTRRIVPTRVALSASLLIATLQAPACLCGRELGSTHNVATRHVPLVDAECDGRAAQAMMWAWVRAGPGAYAQQGMAVCGAIHNQPHGAT
jgi:hypothetical protein